jgi:hypothetical protein
MQAYELRTAQTVRTVRTSASDFLVRDTGDHDARNYDTQAVIYVFLSSR